MKSFKRKLKLKGTYTYYQKETVEISEPLSEESGPRKNNNYPAC